MNHIKLSKPKNTSFVYTYRYKKEGELVFGDQDRKHIRILTILNLSHDHEAIEYILNHTFSESFEVDKERRLIHHIIRIKKERRKYRGDC